MTVLDDFILFPTTKKKMQWIFQQLFRNGWKQTFMRTLIQFHFCWLFTRTHHLCKLYGDEINRYYLLNKKTKPKKKKEEEQEPEHEHFVKSFLFVYLNMTLNSRVQYFTGNRIENSLFGTKSDWGCIMFLKERKRKDIMKFRCT